MKLNVQPAAKLPLRKARRSTSGSALANMRQKNSAPLTAEISAKIVMVSSENQSLRLPSSSTYSSEPRKAAISASPIASKRRASDGSARSMSSRRQTSTTVSRPNGTLIRNSQCQEKFSVSQPPSVGPMVGASVAVSPMTTDICVRRWPENSRKDVANTVGIIAPPRNPCAARNVTMAPSEVANAQANERP